MKLIAVPGHLKDTKCHFDCSRKFIFGISYGFPPYFSPMTANLLYVIRRLWAVKQFYNLELAVDNIQRALTLLMDNQT